MAKLTPRTKQLMGITAKSPDSEVDPVSIFLNYFDSSQKDKNSLIASSNWINIWVNRYAIRIPETDSRFDGVKDKFGDMVEAHQELVDKIIAFHNSVNDLRDS